MSTLLSVTYLTTPDELAWSRITDLDIVQFGGAEMLVGITRFDGVVQGWTIGGQALAAGPVLALDGGDVAGGRGSIVTVQSPTGAALLIGGGADGAFQQVGLAGGQWTSNATYPILPGFLPGLTASVGNDQIVYGALAGRDGVAALRLDVDGPFIAELATTPTGGPVAAMTTAAGFLYTTDATNSLTGWQVSPNGTLSQVAALTPATGLWITDPTVLDSAVFDGVTYLVIGAAGSSSLTVVEVGAQGQLSIRDHLIDTLHTRFGGVTALDMVTEGGRSYVIAGGADDGVSLFMLLPGGQLVALAHIEDTTSIGLDNISAIAARGRLGGLDIYAASSSEPGVTQLRFDTGAPGVTLTAMPPGGALTGTVGADVLIGGAGADIINGGAGADILRDGGGEDVLTGGAGADLFILTADSNTDTITDFTLGEDRLDLSLWPMLRDISQLTMTITQTGFSIGYGDEDLIIHSADGAPIDYRLLNNADLLGAMRLPATLTPGFAGPVTPPPTLTPDAPDSVPDQGGPFSMQAALRVLASDNVADLRGALQGQPVPAPTGDRAMTGTGGNDSLTAGAGADLLLGRGGDDLLTGGAGADIIMGGSGNDDLRGGDGHDLLIGGNGDDRLEGGNGNDLLIGEAGADTFVFNRGQDLIADFEQGRDRIILDERLWTGLTSAADLLFVYGSHDDTRVTIDFGNGDILWIDHVTDFNAFADDIALF
ncbi:calcium-binding protein [Yoonia vestfoldensis]|uniref:calcium-binding protein n=1 Tax=Yoonia vestfoldensis TaxID=245188 RepID=UPI00036642D5|nr:calcium-binding protein [Yoonia vestfoldensis]